MPEGALKEAILAVDRERFAFVWSVIMGKEQDLLVAVKTGDLLLAHKLLTKVKCNKTSEYAANRGRGGTHGLVLLLSDSVFVLCSGPGSVIVSTMK